jgi:hypothetical protein
MLNKLDKKKVLKQFLYARVFLYAGVQVLLNGFSKKGLEIANLSIENKILSKLRKKYRNVIYNYKTNPCKNSAKKCNVIWICWLQGLDSAPFLVQKCIESIRRNLPNKKIVLLTEENYNKYVKFPNFIEEKISNGVITKTHFSDLLRIELLTTYGGTWMDATVFCSGDEFPEYIFESDLFMYQILKPGLGGHPTRISSWFMTANKNSDILNLTKDLLYAYWEKNSDMVSYFLLHDFIELSIEVFSDEWNNVPKLSSGNPHILQYKMMNDICESEFSELIRTTSIHKLSYKNTIKKANYIFLELSGEK